MMWFLETCVLADERVAAFREACAGQGVSLAVTLDVDQPPEPRQMRPAEGANVVAYGSKSVIGYALQRQWKPGVWSGSTFDYVAVQRGLGDHFLNADAVLTSLATAESAARDLGLDRFFVRPFDDNKAFAGMATNVAELPAWRTKMIESGYLDDPNATVIVASLKPLKREWRLVIANGEVAAASLYREDGGQRLLSGAPSDVTTLAKVAAQRYRPDPVFVVDIAEVGGGLAVIEFNCFNSADLYACDIADVVARVSEVARQPEYY